MGQAGVIAAVSGVCVAVGGQQVHNAVGAVELCDHAVLSGAGGLGGLRGTRRWCLGCGAHDQVNQKGGDDCRLDFVWAEARPPR